MDPDRLLDGLNDAQKRAVTTPSVPLCILAGAGSGKTRVLTRRIAYRAATGQHDAQRVLALTFTRKAAGELTSRLRQLGLRDSVVAGTFHAIAFAQLRARWADRGITPPSLLERKVGFVARLIPASATSGRSGRGPAKRDTLPLDVVGEIEWAKARRVRPEDYPSAYKAANRQPPLEARQIAKIYEQYEETKKKRRMVDFDDLLALCVRDLTRDETFAEAQRWRYRHFFVDEYQDVNPLQQALLQAWIGDRSDLCVVGDPNQAIYAWNGADARYLTDFTTTWKRGEVVRLTENYRSTPQILAVANAVLGGSLAASRAAERGEDLGTLHANRPDGMLPTIRRLADDVSEARAIARAVRDGRPPGTRWSSHAVLVRTNAQTATIEKAFRAAQIPFRVKGGVGLLDQPEIKSVIRSLSRSNEDFSAIVRDLEASAERMGPAAEGEVLPPAASWADDPEHDEATIGYDDESLPTVPDTGASPDAAATAADIERRANLDALVRLAHDYQAIDRAPTAAGFVAWLNATTRADQPDTEGDAVDIATFHSAKGLEWPVVHLAGLEQGLVPIGHAQTPLEMAEERRLFYVAVTRAERELHCTWSAERTFGTRAAARERSPYLIQVEAAIDALREDKVPSDWAAHFRTIRQQGGFGGGAEGTDDDAATLFSTRRDSKKKSGRAAGALSDLSPDDQKVFEGLRDWRTKVAKAASVPPYVVVSDATLQAVARARPSSHAQLLQISGIGPVKVQRYGDDVIDVVAASAP